MQEFARPFDSGVEIAGLRQTVADSLIATALAGARSSARRALATRFPSAPIGTDVTDASIDFFARRPITSGKPSFFVCRANIRPRLLRLRHGSN
jgi:hypothetical protein